MPASSAGIASAAATAKTGEEKGAQNQGSSVSPLQNMKSGSLPPPACSLRNMAKP